MPSEIDTISREVAEMKRFFSSVVDLIPRFDITDPKILPYGLKPHTRSVSWIVEQVIVQQAKYHRKNLGIHDVEFDMPDTCLHDCIILRKPEEKYYVNIKITSVKKKQNKNDIAAVEKLYMQYKINKDYRLIYAVFPFSFDNVTIMLEREGLHAFSPQFLPIYVNPRNDKVQAYYYADTQKRSRRQFLKNLEGKSRSIVLK